jgi:hypothetical protein
MLDFRPPQQKGRSTAIERLWVLGAVLAVVLPVVLFLRSNREGGRPPVDARGGAVHAISVGNTPVPLPKELQFDPALLDTIRDNTLERPEERPAFLRLLEILQQATPEQIQRATLGWTTYAQLLRQPNQYRGRLVSVRGTVRRVSVAQPPRNSLGIQHYYQLWIEPDDAPSWTIVILSLELPRGFPTGLDVAEEAEITGFFFKRWAYMAQDQMRTAPTLLARTIGWQPALPATRRAPLSWTSLQGTSVLIVGVGVVAIGVWVVWRWRGRRPRRHEPAHVEPDFSKLRDNSSSPDTESNRSGSHRA